MILTCPACSTRFLVAHTAIGGTGRRVRCAKCHQVWLARPPADVPPPIGLTPSPLPAYGTIPDALPPPRYPVPAIRRPRPRPWVVAGWLGLAAALLLIIGGLVFAREQVMAQWPRTARLYALAGLSAEPPGAGLEFRQVKSERTEENGAAALVVEGEVANVSLVPRGVPTLRVVLHDRERHELQSVSVAPLQAELPPGGSLPFRALIPRPSEAATGLVVTFAGGA
jgi:predicted Zn finger-like uncharacterized protein